MTGPTSPVVAQATLMPQRDRDLARRSIAGAFVYLALWLIIPLTTELGRSYPLATALVTVLLVLLSGARLMLAWRFEALSRHAPQHWRRGFTAAVLASAAVWGTVCALIVAEHGLGGYALMMLLATAGIAAGGVTSLSPSRALVTAFLALLLLPGAGASYFVHEQEGAGVALLFLSFFGFLLMVGRRLYAEYWRALENQERLAQNTATLRRQTELLGAVRRVQERYITGADTPTTFGAVLDDLCTFTGSAFGFLGELRRESDGTPWLKTYAISNIAWNDETRARYARAAEHGLEFRNLHSLIGAVLTSGAPVVSNDPARDPRRGGLPDGHPPLHAFLGLPLYAGTALVGMVGLANRVGGYRDTDVAELEPLLQALARLIEANRVHAAQAQAEAEMCAAKERAEQALAVIATQEHALGAHSIVAVTDPGGRITYVNDKFCQLSQYSRTELIGQAHRLVKSGLHPPAFYQDLWQTIVRGEIWQGELCNRARDGSLYWVQTTIAPFRNASGRITKYVSIRTDITAQKRIEEELRRAKEAAERANRSKSEFLANMSHEIRTPMHGVLGMLELVRDTPLAPGQQEYIDVAYRSAENLLRLLSDILDATKIEVGRLELEAIDFDLARLVAEVCALHRQGAHNKGIALSLALSEHVPAVVRGDPTRLRQVLNNLLGNAVKFTEQGEVQVRVEAPSGIGLGEALPVTLAVKDSGIGIRAEQLARIFEPFTQADGSITRTHGGTGLGLSISRQIAQKMGGDIRVTSTPGQGATFTAHLMLRRAGDDALTTPVAVDAGTSLTGRRVLVVEDNPVNQRVALGMLAKLGCRVDLVGDGEEGVEAWAQGGYDCVLMDIQMPKVDGIEATRRIRAAEGGARHVPIIAMTAHARDTDREDCLAAGMDAYLTKPLQLHALRQALARWLPLTGSSPAAGVLRAASVLDARQVAELRAVLGAEFGVLVQTFLDSVPQHLATLRVAGAAGDAEQLRHTVHTLKGVAANLGAEQLAAQCRELEQRVRNGDLVHVGPAVEAIARAGNTASEALRAELGQQAA